MGCGASAPVVDGTARADAGINVAVTPKDPAHAPQGAPADAQGSAAPGPQPTAPDPEQPEGGRVQSAGAASPSAPRGADEPSPRGGGTDAAPAAPSGVGAEGAEGAGVIAYDEAADVLEWGHERFGVEALGEQLESLNASAVQHELEEWLPLVCEDALRFSSAYEALRTAAGGPEAIDELAHECAAIRQKVLEDRGDTSGANTSFDRGEGDEEEVDNFWNEPFFLLVSAAKVYDKFAAWVASIASQAGADGAHTVCFKPIASAAQKARRPAWARGAGADAGAAAAAPGAGGAEEGRGWGAVVDLVRGSIVVDSWDGVLRCLQLVRGDFDVEILRVRNRFTATADVPKVWGGYRHVALTVRLLGHGHVCELLIHHRQLFALRTPASDERFHTFRDALAWSQAGANGVETFTQLLSPRSPGPV